MSYVTSGAECCCDPRQITLSLQSALFTSHHVCSSECCVLLFCPFAILAHWSAGRLTPIAETVSSMLDCVSIANPFFEACNHFSLFLLQTHLLESRRCHMSRSVGTGADDGSRVRAVPALEGIACLLSVPDRLL